MNPFTSKDTTQEKLKSNTITFEETKSLDTIKVCEIPSTTTDIKQYLDKQSVLKELLLTISGETFIVFTIESNSFEIQQRLNDKMITGIKNIQSTHRPRVR